MAVLCAWLPVTVAGQPEAPPLGAWHHSAWTARDGLEGRPRRLAQTTDGFLWIGTGTGLFRFDGVQFERHAPVNGPLPHVAVSALTATPDGALWIGYTNGGVSRVDATGRATHYASEHGVPYGPVRSLAQTRDGAIWMASVGGLARLQDGRWHRVREQWAYPCLTAHDLFVARDGRLWVGGASPDRLMSLPAGAQAFQAVANDVATGRITEAADGTIVIADRRDAVIHAVRRRADGHQEVSRVAALPATDVIVDTEGHLWVAGFGVARLVAVDGTSRTWRGDVAARDRFERTAGLSGSIANDLLIDRENNLWVATDAGIDRFRRRNLSWRPQRRESWPTRLVAGPDGDVWAMWPQAGVIRVTDDAVVPGMPVALAHGHRAPDAVWVASGGALWRWKDGHATRIAPPDPVARKGQTSAVLALTTDRAGRLWASYSGFGQFRRDGEAWTFVPVLAGRPDLTAVAAHADLDGRVWLVYPEALAVVDGATVREYPARSLGVGALRTVTGTGREVWVGGEAGIAVSVGDGFQALPTSRDSVRLGSVASLVVTRERGAWINASARIVHLPADALARWRADHTHAVTYSALDLLSDLPEPLQDHHGTVVEAADGAIWFVTMHGVARVDPSALHRNTLPPPVVIRTLLSDDRAYPTAGRVEVPPRSRTIRIDYTGLSLTLPERVRFRYRLDGWDDDWHDVGTRRSAFYTDLRPGTYALRVLASNNDGVWNETGATLAFRVVPAWYQTLWFRGLAGAAVIAGLVLAYRWRVRQVATAMTARFDERLAERTRLARELHDTLVQTVQGSKMVAEHALDHVDDAAATRRQLERLSGWLGQAVHEARGLLDAIRTSTREVDDLAGALDQVASTVAREGTVVTVATHGVQRAMHPVARDEVYWIGHEAIRNACTHARAKQVRVEIDFGRDLVLQVSDDGVGIDPAVAASGRNGRYGLPGMRERASAIGASLSVAPGPIGTTVRLTAPGRLVYRAAESQHSSGSL